MSLFDNLSGIKIEMRECNDFLNSLHLKKKKVLCGRTFYFNCLVQNGLLLCILNIYTSHFLAYEIILFLTLSF